MRLTVFLLIIFCYACDKKPITTNKKDALNNTVNKTDSLSYETIVAKLDLAMIETSGLARIGDSYWTLNDSGNEPELYNFDIASGMVKNTVKIKGAKNKDWESLAHDNEFIYIGDFGNNKGGRDNLKIYQVSLQKLSATIVESTNTIKFKYPDQEKFYSGYNHNFDCEAMVSQGDSLFLFSKNWLDKKCKLYGISKEPGKQTATLMSEFDSGGTITGASLNNDNTALYLLGYNGMFSYSSFLWVITDWVGSDYLTGSKIKYQLSINRQTEGIMIDTDGSILISAEQNKGGHPSLYRVKI